MIAAIVGWGGSIGYFSHSWCGIGYFGNGHGGGYSNWLSNDGLARFFHNSIETIDFIGSVGDLKEDMKKFNGYLSCAALNVQKCS